uniref:Response regulatory domain-containing protein n=1 Tax=uncultured bacterium FLS18 TaxID=654935 RepID=C6G410_9BACT|nr:hypothetical protein MC7420_6780 [uncultured bacterium FLS18]
MSTGIELGRPIEILLVEDSPTDASLTKEALKRGKIRNNVHLVEDGEQAMSFLRRDSPYQDVPRPDLILLDLNLPRKDGREVLAEIRADPQLKSAVVIVLTTSADEKDILRAYGLNANCYVTKPVDMDQFMVQIKAIENFWLTIVKLPSSM